MDAAVREQVLRRCRAASDPIELHRSVAAVLPGAVPFARWCGLVIDPATLISTGGYHAEGLPEEVLPRLVEIEAGEPDVNTMPHLARSRAGVSTIDRATRGDTSSSPRYRDVLEPSGLGRELRAVLRDRGTAWGGLVLFRETGASDFTDEEVVAVAEVAGELARGIRRCLLLSELEHRDADDVPGMAVLQVDGDDVRTELLTRAARRWLSEVQDGEIAGTGLPVAAVALAMRARARPAQPVSTHLRARSGQWLTLHAEVLSAGPPARVSLVVEPTRPHELAEVVAAAYGLTDRERQVARLVVSGHSTREVAQALWLSPWTVQDHLKKVFAKLGVGSRAEMTSRLFFDQYLPRMASGAALGGDGWYVPGDSRGRAADA